MSDTNKNELEVNQEVIIVNHLIVLHILILMYSVHVCILFSITGGNIYVFS